MRRLKIHKDEELFTEEELKFIKEDFKLYFEEISDLYPPEIDEDPKNSPEQYFGDDFKVRTNRTFRDRGFNIPYPEVDNTYERLRGKLVYTCYSIVEALKKFWRSHLHNM